jgi:catechol 2,3-dioxygenase-like lactoylglutathione lyase family enzyme
VPLNHLKLIVSDLDRSVRFYSAAFGMDVLERDANQVVLTTPGSEDVLTLAQAGGGEETGLDHLGFFGHGAGDFEATVARVEGAGGKLVRRSDNDDEQPTAFFADPDGFSVQI